VPGRLHVATAAPAGPGLARRLAILWVLYFVQGLPFGFQATALPVYLREAGVSLTGIGLVTALALPWSLKLFWAPLVDRFGSRRLGRRRSWILPLQLGLAACCAAATAVRPADGLTPLLLLVLAMNLFAATLDVAVDGLAVDVLALPELGHGNVAQVVGYKMGMLTGGGLLVWASGTIGWEGLFLSMAALVAACLLVTLAWRERHLADPLEAASPLVHPRMGEILAALRRAVAAPGARWLLLFVGTYKLGESMADTMFKPFLVDAGFSAARIGLWVGTWGMLFSIAGSVAGGLLAGRVPLLHAAGITAFLRALSVGGEWWLSVVTPTPERVIAVTCAEHLFGGALTTALFAYMMSRVDRRIGATHYTLLASIEVWGKLPSAWVSGWIAEASSYTLLFAISTVLSLAFLALLRPLRAAGPGASTPLGPARAE
jgi:MFS family permease